MIDWQPFGAALETAVGDGLSGAALVDRAGKVVGCAGTLSEDEAMPLAALVMYRLKTPDLWDRLFAGEIISLDLDDRTVAVSVARPLTAIVGDGGANGGSSSGPAELPLVEWGITARRKLGQA